MSSFRTARGAVAMAVLGLGLFACDNGVTVDNENPKGTVGGLIVDASTQLPLEGVAIRILSAGGTFESTTGTDGFYRIAEVPSGSFIVELGKPGFLSARLPGELDGAVGNFPISMPIATYRPIALVPTGPDFVVRVIDSNGVAVSGVTASARSFAGYGELDEGSLELQGTVNVSATTAADGRLVFKGLPDMVKLGGTAGQSHYDPLLGYLAGDTFVIAVSPVAVSGQDNYQFSGGYYQFRALQLGTSLPQIVLSGSTDALTVLESNIEWLKTGFISPMPGSPSKGSIVDGAITIAFSEAINPATLRATVTTEAGLPGPALTPTVNLNLASLAGSFDAGKRYNLFLSAETALNPGVPSRQRVANVPFFAKPAADTKPTVVSAKLTAVAPATTPPTFTIAFVLSEPIGIGDGSTLTYDCALFHEGANFDGSGAGVPLVAGEWATDAGSLSCTTASPVAAATAPATSNGRLTGTESLGNPATVAATGFTSTFSATVGPYVQTAMPTMPMPGAVVPAVGGKGHLYFSKLPGTVMRANGEPVTDIAFTLQ